MEKYEQIAVVGEGSYGIVMKCRHRETDQVVAVKKFLETEEDATVRKMALREIRMLKRLKHENLVTMIEVFRYRKRFYLVFEFLDGTILDELEKMPRGFGEERSRERIFQVLRAVNYCHSNNIIHRDVKPENVLVSSLGVVKLCDFGFARMVSMVGEPCTEYVATRWYRAPELLVGESTYSAPIDIWAVGCLYAEMMTGDPVFPGESDIDQLYLIVKMLGKPTSRHQQLMSKNSQLRGMIKSAAQDSGIYKTFPSWPLLSLEFISSCLKMDPADRLTADELLKHHFFTHDRFPQRFLPALRDNVNLEFNNNQLLRKFKTEILMSTDKSSEAKPRRLSHNEQCKWKFNFTESGTKRKLSCDTSTTQHEDKNLISLDKSSQRLNVVHRPVVKQQPVQNKEKVKSTAKTPASNNSEMQMLEKSLESLVKFSQQKEQEKEECKYLPKRSASAQKEQHDLISPTTLPHSPPQFQSLQQNYAFGDYNRNNQNVLHPSINNISFNKDPTKKSPSLFQSSSNTNMKPLINQIPVFSNYKNSQFLKKLDRGVVVDNMMTGDHLSTNSLGTSWLTGITSNIHKKRECKPRNDDFTLPNLPGATCSPNKTKKKTQQENDLLQSNTVTPAFRYMKSKRKLQTLDISLPLSVKEKG